MVGPEARLCIRHLQNLGYVGLLGCWWDVVVAPEQVGGVIAALDRGQPLPGAARVGLADPVLALVANEVDIDAGDVLADRGDELADQATWTAVSSGCSQIAPMAARIGRWR